MKAYRDLVRLVLIGGEPRSDRTGTGTLSVFGTQTRLDLRQGFPVLTTKRMHWRNAIRETLWFLRGETNTQTLGCGIWDAWADETGACGPVYGAQWRAFGGVDQIMGLIEGIRKNPAGRRHVVSAWNPVDLPAMALPPCHVLFQCYVGGITADAPTGQWLDLHLYQRSADLALGVPFNWIGYSFLLEILARASGLTARYFIHSIGDAHIYQNHLTGISEQLTREPRSLPRIAIPAGISFESLLRGDASDADRIELIGYDPAGRIRYPIAV